MIKFEFIRASKKEDTINMLSILAQLIQRLLSAESGGSDELLELRHMQQLYKDYFEMYTRSNDARRVVLNLSEKLKDLVDDSGKPSFSAEQEKRNYEAFLRLKLPTPTCSVAFPPPTCSVVSPPAVVSSETKPKNLPKGAVHHAMAPVEMEFWDMRCECSEIFDDEKFIPAFDSFYKFFSDKMIVEKVAGSMFLFTVILIRSEANMIQNVSNYKHEKIIKVYNIDGRIPSDDEGDALRAKFRETYVNEPKTESEVIDMFRLIFRMEVCCLVDIFLKSGTIVY